MCGVKGKLLRPHLEKSKKSISQEEPHNISRKLGLTRSSPQFQIAPTVQKEKMRSHLHPFMCLIQIQKWFSLNNGMVVLGLATSHHDSTIGGTVRLHSNLDGSSLAHAIQVPMGPLLKSESWKQATVEVLLLFRSSTHTHTHALPQQGLFRRCRWRGWIRRQWLKSGRIWMMIEVIAKWQAAEEAWKTDAEGTETSDVTECRNTTWSPRPKFTVTRRCRAENVQLGKGHSCGAAEARRRMAAKEHDGW